MVDNTATGSGDSFATYDEGFDAAGLIGVRPLRGAEYFTGPLIQNPADGGATPTDANVRIFGLTTLGASGATVNTLTLSGTGDLTMTAEQILHIGNAAILTQRGSAAAISGGAVSFPGNRLSFYGGGDLAFGSTASSPGTIEKYGFGTLTLLDQAGFPSSPLFLVHEGVLQSGSGGVLRTSRVEMESGATLELANATAQIGSLEGSGTVALGSGTLVIGGYYFPSGSFSGSISGNGGISVTDDMAWTLHGSSSYSGPTAVYRDPSKPVDYPFNGPSIGFLDKGSALSSTNFTARASTIDLSNSLGVEDRLGPVPVTLIGATFRMIGNSFVASAESTGSLTIAGFSEVLVRPDPYGSSGGMATALNFTDLFREDRGTLIIGTEDFNSIGGKASLGFAPTLQASLIGAGTTATDRGILPFAVLEESSSLALVTFDPTTGIRALAASEYSSALTTGDNVRLSGGATVSSPITINSLLGRDVNGSAILTVASGTVIAGGTISAPLNFGSIEGKVFNAPNTTLTLSGPITGSDGLTLSGTGSSAADGFRLDGNNTFTGTLTINSGNLRFVSAANLGADSSDIVINDAMLEYTGADAFTLTRGVRTNGWQSTFASSGGPLTLAGEISGPSSLRTVGDVTLTGANTYNGYTDVEGVLSFAGDEIFGRSPLVHLNATTHGGASGVLKLTAPWTTERELLISGIYQAAINTNGFNATINGPINSELLASGFVKDGAGVLTITDAILPTGGVEIREGRLEILGTLGAPSTSTGALAVMAGGSLGGSGSTIRTITVSPDGTIDPGELARHAALTVGSVFLNQDSLLHFDLYSATSFDRLIVNGTATFAGLVTLSLSIGYDPQDGVDSFILFDNDGTDAITGTSPHHFAIAGVEIDEGGLFTTGGQQFRLSYVGGDGNDVAIAAVPEPAAGALWVTGVVALITGLRSRRRSVRTK